MQPIHVFIHVPPDMLLLILVRPNKPFRCCEPVQYRPFGNRRSMNPRAGADGYLAVFEDRMGQEMVDSGREGMDQLDTDTVNPRW